MKTKDIKIGAHYAVAKDWQWKISRYSGGRDADEAVVLAVGVKRKVYPRDSFHGYLVDDGVKIRRVGAEEIDVVRPAEIRMDWAEYKAEEKARRAARKKAEAEKKSYADASAKRLRKALDKAGIETRGYDEVGGDRAAPYWLNSFEKVHGDGSRNRGGNISHDELAALLEQAYEAGRRDGIDDAEVA